MLDIVSANFGEIQRDYLYKLIIDSNGRTLRTDSELVRNLLTKDGVSLGEKNDINILIDTYNVKAFESQYKAQVLPLKWGGRMLNFLGTDESVKQGNLEFLDDENGNVYNFFYTLWKRNVPKKVVNKATPPILDSKQGFTFSIQRISATKAKVTSQITYSNGKIVGVTRTEPNKQSNQLSRVTVTLVWDDSDYMNTNTSLR